MQTDRDPDPAHESPQAPVEAAAGEDAGHNEPGTRVSLWQIAKRTVRRFLDLHLTDWAAGLTYYAVLSIFPGLLVLVSVLGLMGRSTTNSLIEYLTKLAPGAVGNILTEGITNLQESPASAGVLAIVGLAAALWSASGYIGAFMRASNAIYAVPEGRPLWLTWPIRLAITIVVGVLMVISTALVVFTGQLLVSLGELIGWGGTFVVVWDLARWPVLVLLVSLIFAVLYWAAPNAKVGRFRWFSAGGLLAVLVWVLASVGFGVYAANFGSYNKTYGTLGGVIIFLIWLWISNIAVLLGAQFDSELKRARTEAAGHPVGQDPFMELRDTRNLTADRARS